jgi:hypothetical protein
MQQQLAQQQQEFQQKLVPVTNPLTGVTGWYPQKAADAMQQAYGTAGIAAQGRVEAAQRAHNFIPTPAGVYDVQAGEFMAGTAKGAPADDRMIAEYPELAPVKGQIVPTNTLMQIYKQHQEQIRRTTDPFGLTTTSVTTKQPGTAAPISTAPSAISGAPATPAAPAPPAGAGPTSALAAGGHAAVPPRTSMVGGRFGLSSAALDQAAEKYFSTGQLPPGTRGAPGLIQNRAIMNRAAELHPQGNLAANTAEFKANAASLAKLQTNYDQVTSFENTARKNMDLAEQLANDIPDLGLRFANIPLRAINANMIGTEAMAKFNTAMQTSQTEAARVLNNAQASGILTDTARNELRQIQDGSLPVGSLKGVFNVLRQDMANRNQSYAEQIADIKRRMQGGGKQDSLGIR